MVILFGEPIINPKLWKMCNAVWLYFRYFKNENTALQLQRNGMKNHSLNFENVNQT